MKNNVMITNFMPEDTAAIHALLVLSSLTVQDISPEKLARFLAARNADGAIIGTTGLEAFSEAGLFRSLAVHPDWRGTGLGKKLTAGIEDMARRLGLKQLFLLTTTAPDFFRKSGYQAISRTDVPDEIAATEEFRGICPASAKCFCKTL